MIGSTLLTKMATSPYSGDVSWLLDDQYGKCHLHPPTVANQTLFIATRNRLFAIKRHLQARNSSPRIPWRLMTTPPSSGTNDRRRDFLRDSLILAGAVPGALAGAVAQSAVPVWQPVDQRPLKLAILGCGRRGSQLARLAGAQAEVPIEIVALGDLFADRVQQLFRSLSGEFPRCAGRQLTTRVSGRSAVRHMADSDADLVVVAAATGCRPEQVEQLITAGKSVYAERPVATDPVSLLRFADLDSLARRRGVALQVGLQHRHQAFYAETIARIHAGTIGRPRLARIELTGPAVDDPLDAKPALSEANRWRQWRRDPALGGGPLLEALCGSDRRLESGSSLPFVELRLR